MHFQRRKSFFADNPKLDDVAQSCSSESFDDREYEDLLSKYSDGGAYSSHGRAMENQQQVQNVKDKITSMKKKFQSLAMVCDYVEGMEKYEHALETDPDSKMVKELTHKLENLRAAPKIHTNEHSYASSSGNNAEPKQYGISLADKRRQMARANLQVSSAASSRVPSRASSPSRSALPANRLREASSPSRHQAHHAPPRDGSPLRHLAAANAAHRASPHRFITVPARSRNCSTSRPDTRDVATQVGRARISSDSDDEKQRDSGVSTHDEDEENARGRKKIDNRLKRELLKPKFYLNESGNLVRVSSDDSLADVLSADGLPPKPPTASSASTATAAAATTPGAPPLRIYYDFVSSSCRALYVFLKLAAVEFEAHPVQLRAGEQFQPEFEKLSPARRLPVMDDDGFILREAMPICRYIAEKRGLAKRWCHCELGSDGGLSVAAGKGSEDNDSNVFVDEETSDETIKSRAIMDEYLSWHQSHLRPVCLQIFTQATLTPILSGQPPDFRRLKALKIELDKHCQYLENVFLQKGEFIGGREVGICDLFAVCELMQPYAAGFDVRQSNLRRVRQWIERVKRETRPFFDEANAEVMKIWESKGRYVIDEYDDFFAGCDHDK